MAAADFDLKTGYVPENKKKKEDFLLYLDDYIKSKEKKVKNATLGVYSQMARHLEAFQIYRKQEITFESLDYQFYNDFIDYVAYEHPKSRKKRPFIIGLRQNTIGKTIKQLRIIIRDRRKRKVIPYIDLTGYKIPEEESNAIYLSYEEIGMIYRLNLSEKPDLIPYRNFFFRMPYRT